MTPERMAGLVARWVRFYTRNLPQPIAHRRIAEIDADLASQTTRPASCSSASCSYLRRSG